MARELFQRMLLLLLLWLLMVIGVKLSYSYSRICRSKDALYTIHLRLSPTIAH